MKRAAATRESSRDQGAPLEARTSARLGADDERSVGATTHAPSISVVTAAFFTLLVQAALTFQKFRFDGGLRWEPRWLRSIGVKMLLAARTSPPSRLTLILITTIAAAFTVALQQAAHVLAGLTQTITHS